MMKTSMRSKIDERPSIYERSVRRLQEREEKLKRLETKIMSEYTFAPDVSLSKIKPSRQVTPKKEPKTPRSRLLLKKSPATSDYPISPHRKQLSLIGKESVQRKTNTTTDRSPSRIPGKAKPAIEHESPRPYLHAEDIPAEVFVSLSSMSIPTLTNADDEKVDATAETLSESISRIPDNHSEHSEDMDSGSI